MLAHLLLLALMAAQSVQEGQEPATVGGRIQPPQRVKDVSPEYPDDALKAGLEGVVVLECIIDTEGRVSKVEFFEGPPPFKKSAVEAVKQWRYERTFLEGQPVPVIMTVTVNFKHSRQVKLDELVDSLRHKDEYIREAAARTIGRLGPRAAEAVPALMKAKDDESERVRKAAAKALESVQGN